MLIDNRFFRVFRTAARGMEAQRVALGTTTENIANANTSRAEGGTPYAVKRAVHTVADASYENFSTILNRRQLSNRTTDPRHMQGGVLRSRLPEMELGPLTDVEGLEQTRLEFDPSHPHANAEGYVEYPDVNVVEEMARMVSANRIYEANLSAVQAAKEMIKRTIEI